jgi:hypothetical protein
MYHWSGGVAAGATDGIESMHMRDNKASEGIYRMAYRRVPEAGTTSHSNSTSKLKVHSKPQTAVDSELITRRREDWYIGQSQTGYTLSPADEKATIKEMDRVFGGGVRGLGARVLADLRASSGSNTIRGVLGRIITHHLNPANRSDHPTRHYKEVTKLKPSNSHILSAIILLWKSPKKSYDPTSGPITLEDTTFPSVWCPQE